MEYLYFYHIKYKEFAEFTDFCINYASVSDIRKNSARSANSNLVTIPVLQSERSAPEITHNLTVISLASYTVQNHSL